MSNSRPRSIDIREGAGASMSAPNRTGFRMACAASKQPDFHTSNCERFHARRIRPRGEYPTPPLENHHRFCACGKELEKNVNDLEKRMVRKPRRRRCQQDQH